MPQSRPPWPSVLGLVVLALGLWLFFVASIDAHDDRAAPSPARLVLHARAAGAAVTK